MLFKQEGNKILANLRAQRQEGKNCDITLMVQGRRHIAHRSILAASSPFFEKLLKNQRLSAKDELRVDWDDSQSFELLIDFLYSGEVVLDEENILTVCRLAHHFMIAKLKQHCEQYYANFLSLENCLSVRDHVEEFSLMGLKDAVSQFIADHITDVLPQTALMQMPFEKFGTFIADPATGCDSISHHSLLTTIASWVKFDLSHRVDEFPHLLEVVNWSDADPSEIIKHIESESLYQESKQCLFFMLRVLVKSNVEIGTYAEVYEELCEKFEEMVPDMAIHEPATPMVITNEEDDMPVSRGPGTRSGLRSKQADVPPPSRSTRKRPAPEPEVDANQENESEDANPSGRPSRRRVKPKSFSSDWVTDDDMETRPTSSPAKRGKKTMIKIESTETNGDSADSQNEAGVEAIEFDAEDSEDTANESHTNQDDEEAALKRVVERHKSVAGVTKSQWKQGIKCEECTYVGYSVMRLDQHIQKVHLEDQTFKCSMCAFECKWNREYYKHMKSHYDGPPYKCESCEYTCDRIQFILSHRMKHTDERPFACELCDFSSRTKGNLIVHMRIHTGEKPYRCQHCGRCFAMKNTLDQHMATHRDDRPFLCDTCGFTTKYKSHLLSHERIHSGNVFHCEQDGCSYFSPRRSQLAAHMRSHMSIRSHICSTCGRGFIEKSHLIRHERIHLDDKPFKCDSCDYGSTRRDKLKEHKAKYHGAEGGTPVASGSASRSSSRPSRSRKAAANRNIELLMDQGDEQETTTHVVHISNGDDEDDEQNAATAYLIDTGYADDGTGQGTRIVLQGDGGEQTVYVEGQAYVDGDDSNQERVIVIHTASPDDE